MLYAIIEFFTEVCSNAAMLPALWVMYQNRRHFEFFIGTFHFFICVMFQLTKVLDMPVVLEEIQWHEISDVLGLAYGLLLLVHFMGIPHEDINHFLRYLAFALAWITKSRDGWDTIQSELMLILVYGVGAVYRNVTSSRTKSPVRMEHVQKATGSCVVMVLVFLFMEMSDFEDSLGLCYCGFHVMAGFTSYHGWKAVPVRDTKKYDEFDLMSGSKSNFS